MKVSATDVRLYVIWSGMLRRCNSVASPAYHYYGARGIKVCPEWSSSRDEFTKWALANGYDDSLSIDRINNDGNYEPSNCRWATPEQQANNRRTPEFIDRPPRLPEAEDENEAMIRKSKEMIAMGNVVFATCKPIEVMLFVQRVIEDNINFFPHGGKLKEALEDLLKELSKYEG